MRSILQKKGLRFIFGANLVSMLGSGMNSAAVAWYILQATHSEIALGTFAVVQTCRRFSFSPSPASLSIAKTAAAW